MVKRKNLADFYVVEQKVGNSDEVAQNRRDDC